MKLPFICDNGAPQRNLRLVIALDTIEVRADSTCRYVITCTDLHSHFAWAWATRSHASLAASHFFRLIQAVFPFAIEAVLTDNGSEFQRHFASELANRLFTHWHTYPKTPRMNAHCERFNRTLQEECIDYHYAPCCSKTTSPSSTSNSCATSPGTTSSDPTSA